MRLNKINYRDLNARQKEAFNFQKVAGLLADYGFNCIKLADDWQGADFLAHHYSGSDTLKVQLKARATVCKKYEGKGLYITFPVHGMWYLLAHDELLTIIGEHATWLQSSSWKQANGQYSSTLPNAAIMAALEPWKLA